MNPDPQDLRRAAEIFKVLSHPARLALACRIVDGEPTTQRELIAELGWPQSTMARHLAPLRQLGLIVGHRKGPEVVLAAGCPVTRDLMAVVCRWVHPETGERFAQEYRGADAEA